MFAGVFPGRPLALAEWRQVSPKQFVLDVPMPAAVREFAISLLKPEIPQAAGCAVCYALPPFKEWQYVGTVSLATPTQFFRAPWYEKIPANTPVIQIGVTLEPLEKLKELAPSDQKEAEREVHSALGIAKDLFNFMSSFTKDVPGHGEAIIVPKDVLDRWKDKFIRKHARDPFFWLKKTA